MRLPQRSRADALRELRIADLCTFMTVHRTASITAASRELGGSPSQVSKAITRLEKAVSASLFIRGARGMTLTSIGREMYPQLAGAFQLLQSLDRADNPPDGELTFAAPSSLLAPILPGLAAALPRMRLRGIELALALLRRSATDGVFDVALVVGESRGLPARWASVCVGNLRRSLFAPPDIARRLGPRPTAEKLRGHSFVGPLAYDSGQLVSSPDECPLDPADRAIAVEVGTMELALRVAAECGHLVFGPTIAARRHVEDGSLVEIKVDGWDVSQPVHLVCDAARVLGRVHRAIAQVAREMLAEPHVARLASAAVGS